MPTSTWTRLPEARRAAVIAAAEREFAANGFSIGSLNVIARNAGVAKGSLFQYFRDKLDLFGHIVELAATRVGADIDRRSSELSWSDGFFPALTELFEEWMDYFRTHPDDRDLTVRTILELDSRARSLVTNVLDRTYFEFLRPLVVEAQANGFVRQDADVDAFLSLVVLLLPHLADSRLRTVDPLFAIADDRDGGRAEVNDRLALRRLMAVFEDAFGTQSDANNRGDRRLSRLTERWPRLSRQGR